MRNEINSWSERQRLMFIERVLYWRGWINRKDLMDHFGTSAPQATNDLTTYTGINAGGCLYNVRKKRYEASPKMKPQLIVPDMAADFAVMGVALSPHEGVPFVAYPEMPTRSVASDIMRQMALAAYAGDAIEMVYWSLHSGTADKRWITPRTFVNDGLRWHVRALCHRSLEFKDFVLGRIESLGRRELCSHSTEVDEDWIAYEELQIRVNPKLSENRRRALEMDYGMESGVWRLPVRKAMRLYTLRRLGFVKKKMVFPMLNELKELELIGIAEIGKLKSES